MDRTDAADVFGLSLPCHSGARWKREPGIHRVCRSAHSGPASLRPGMTAVEAGVVCANNFSHKYCATFVS